MSGLWNELLPTSVDIDGTEYEIRSDYRAALDICMAMADAELDEQDKAFTMLDIFYPGFADMPAEHYQQAIERCLWFINCGEEETERQHIKLMDWEQDFKYIVAPGYRDGNPLNRVYALVDLHCGLLRDRGLHICADRPNTGQEGQREAVRQDGAGMVSEEPPPG